MRGRAPASQQVPTADRTLKLSEGVWFDMWGGSTLRTRISIWYCHPFEMVSGYGIYYSMRSETFRRGRRQQPEVGLKLRYLKNDVRYHYHTSRHDSSSCY